MRNSKFLLVALGIVVLVIILSTSVAFAGPRVAYTWTVADLHQGGHGGGPLFTDGTGRGNFPFVVENENGKFIFQWHIASWEYIVPGKLIDMCFDVRAIKGTPPYPDYLCLTHLGYSMPVTGTPFHWDVDGDGTADAILRATPAN